jgi:hypothetical protein
VKYRVIDNKFRRADWTCGYYITHEPWKETGGFKPPSNAKRPNFKHCEPWPSGFTFKRYYDDGRRYQRSYGVQAGAFLGVSLALTKNYGESSHMVKYKVRGRKKMCGNNDEPGLAGKVMEKKRG